MAAPIFIPPPNQRKTRKCPRCGLWYPETETRCSHCAHLDDRGLRALQEKLASKHAAHKNLGTLFLVITVLLLGWFVVAIVR